MNNSRDKKDNGYGRFLVVEGGEGVGKSTNLAYIHQYLKQHDVDFVATREPGGTPLAEDIRNLLLQTRDEKVAAMTELLLMFAARSQHVNNVILPALKRGQWVVSDRFVDASYVYQGVARQLGVDAVATLDALVLNSCQADAVIVLDAPLAVSQARARERGDLDRFEQESMQFHQMVKDAYLQRAASDPERYYVLDAGQTLPSIQQELDKVLQHQIQVANI